MADADEVDDRPALAAALDEDIRRWGRSGTRGRLVLPWMSPICQVGDRIGAVDGQDLSLASGDGGEAREPLVRSITHELGEQCKTTLELE